MLLEACRDYCLAAGRYEGALHVGYQVGDWSGNYKADACKKHLKGLFCFLPFALWLTRTLKVDDADRKRIPYDSV